jgi:DNA invertase Pin-like site-specific DNA recombinase
MAMRIVIYSRQASGQNGTQVELLCKSIGSRGDTVVGIFADDPAIAGRGKFSGWRAATSELAQIDQIVVNSAGDLPGKSVADLLKILAALSDHGVSLVSSQDGIDTGSGSIAILDLVTAYRAAKRSEAIKAGQARARAAGKRLGRPAVPERVRRRIADDLARGAGVRPTARKFKVSPASVVNVRRSLMDSAEVLAA